MYTYILSVWQSNRVEGLVFAAHQCIAILPVFEFMLNQVWYDTIIVTR